MLAYFGARNGDGRDHFRHPLEFRQVANLAIGGMIPVLTAAARIVADGLQVAQRIAANPDVGPCGRQHERADARERLWIFYRLAIVQINESLAALLPGDSGAFVPAIAKAGHGSGFRRIDR